jgi:hypothetical protein
MFPTHAHPLATLTSLHRAAQIVAGINMLVQPHVPGYLELALIPHGHALNGTPLPNGTQARLDFARAALVIAHGDGRESAVALDGKSQAAVNAELLTAIQPDLPIPLAGEDDRLLDAFTAAVRARYPELEHVHTSFMESAVLGVDTDVSAAYGVLLAAVTDGVRRFHARVGGYWTPLVVYPEHFDLSAVWSAAQSTDDHRPQINVGFAPFTLPDLQRPYWYATAYPYPQPMVHPALPAPARWHTAGWTGVVIDDSEIAAQPDSSAFIESISTDVFHVLRALLPA